MNINLLKGKMAEKQVTQGILATKMGISENSLSRKMLGKREFRLSEVVSICEILEIDNPKAIFFDNNDPKMQRKKIIA